MKQLLNTIILTLLTTTFSYSQDLIVKINSEVIKSKVIEINQDEIKYKSFDNLNGPIKSISKMEVEQLKYENGHSEVFNSIKDTTSVQNNISAQDFFKLGTQDAKTYYKGYSGASTGTLLTGLIVSPFIGLVPAIASASTPPSERNLNYPSSKLMQNPEYAKGYIEKSFKIKKSEVWYNWIASFGISIVTYTILYNHFQK